MLTPKTGYNIKYIDLGTVTTFTDNSTNITLTNTLYAPTPVVGNPSRVLLTDTDRPLKVLKSDGTLVYSFPPIDGTSGQIPFTNGSGLINWGGIENIGGVVAIAHGGTGASSLAAGGIVYENYAGALTSNANFVYNGGRLYHTGDTSLGTGSVPSAKLMLGAGTSTSGTSPLKFIAGTNMGTAEAGSVEYNGTNLFFTRSGTTRENVLVAVDNATAPGTTATPVFTAYYGGNTNALGDPVRWLSVNVLGSVYKIPLYT